MGTATQVNDHSRRLFEATRATPLYQLSRLDCMTGRLAEEKDKNSPLFQNTPNAEIGEVCRLIMEHSATVELAPNGRKDQTILAPYLAIVDNKISLDPTYRETDERDGVPLVQRILKTIENPEIGGRATPVGLPTQNPAYNVPITGGVALDAGFSAAIWKYTKSGTMPARTTSISDADLTLYLEGCSRNNGQLSLLQCQGIGEELAANFLNRSAANNIARGKGSGTPSSR